MARHRRQKWKRRERLSTRSTGVLQLIDRRRIIVNYALISSTAESGDIFLSILRHSTLPFTQPLKITQQMPFLRRDSAAHFRVFGENLLWRRETVIVLSSEWGIFLVKKVQKDDLWSMEWAELKLRSQITYSLSLFELTMFKRMRMLFTFIKKCHFLHWNPNIRKKLPQRLFQIWDSKDSNWKIGLIWRFKTFLPLEFRLTVDPKLCWYKC